MTESSNSLSSGPREVLPGNNVKNVGSNAHGAPTRPDGDFHVPNDATIFSSSLPVLSHLTLNLNDSDHGSESLEDVSSGLSKFRQENQDIGSILPDDDELLAGVTDDFDLSGLPASLEELEECDIFGTGGMELENDSRDGLSTTMSKLGIADKLVGNRTSQIAHTNSTGNMVGEHPYGEHPSRTLFVRNINSNVEDPELRTLFEQFGNIRSMYTACKHRGFVMISYYDIRAARTAMRALQNKPLRRRKLDIHYSIPKDNPSDKDMNQGTLVIFNLDHSVSNEELVQIFGIYGEVKEIRETPHKRHHKFIEFYDVRAAEAALKGLNRIDIAGRRIKLEPSRPGGARRNLMMQSSQEFDQEESRSSWHQSGSPMMNSPPGNWMPFNSTVEHGHMQTVSQSSGLEIFGSLDSNMLPGLASILQPQVKNSMTVPPHGMDQGKGSHMEKLFSDAYSGHGVSFQKPHSFPEPNMSLYNSNMSSFRHLASNGSGTEKLSRQQFLWGSPKLFPQQPDSPACPKPVRSRFSSDEGHGHPYLGQNSAFAGLTSPHYQHHVGSAPSGVPLESHFGFFTKSLESTFIAPVAFGERNDGSFMMNQGAQAAKNSGINVPANMSKEGSSCEMRSSPNIGPILLGNNSHNLGFAASSIKGLSEWGGSRQMEDNGSHVDSKKQFQLDLDKIKSGEDTRTTLMIKNIPNKYTSKMLLTAIEENHKGNYDFFYLPIDFKNKCNVGYAFINMLSPADIIPLYEEFNGKKWEKFNSEKIASLAYARIQGKTALVSHFQNSGLMNEDRRCRPILFNSGALTAGDQVHVCSNNSSIHGQRPNDSRSTGSRGSTLKDNSGEKPDIS